MQSRGTVYQVVEDDIGMAILSVDSRICLLESYQNSISKDQKYLEEEKMEQCESVSSFSRRLFVSKENLPSNHNKSPGDFVKFDEISGRDVSEQISTENFTRIEENPLIARKYRGLSDTKAFSK
eukprot:Sdes_comp20873_c0_seq3m17829